MNQPSCSFRLQAEVLGEGFDCSLVRAEHRDQETRVDAIQCVLHGVKPAVHTDHGECGAVATIGER